MAEDPAPKNPSHSRTPRRTAAGADPPNQSRGYGFCSGLGSIAVSSSCQNSPSKVTDGSVQSAFISSTPSVKRGSHRSGDRPNAANGRRGPPDPIPISTRPTDSWSSEASALARWAGVCRVVTNTVQPSRRVLVQAAAYVMTSSGASCGAAPSTISCVQALSNTPSSSTRARYALKSDGENDPSG